MISQITLLQSLICVIIRVVTTATTILLLFLNFGFQDHREIIFSNSTWTHSRLLHIAVNTSVRRSNLSKSILCAVSLLLILGQSVPSTHQRVIILHWGQSTAYMNAILATIVVVVLTVDEMVTSVPCVPLYQIYHPSKQYTGSFINLCDILNKKSMWNQKIRLTFGVKYAWYLFKILITFRIRLGLILVGSISTNSNLNVMLDIISLAKVQLGATQPFKIQTICKTFSISVCGFIIFFKSIRWAFVNLLIDYSVISTA